MRKNLLLSLVILCISVLGTLKVSSQTYVKAELKNLRDFLIQESNSKDEMSVYYMNYELLCTGLSEEQIAALNSNDEGWWADTSWMSKFKLGSLKTTTIEGVTYVQEIYWKRETDTGGIKGSLDLRACKELMTLDIPQQSQTVLYSVQIWGAKLQKVILNAQSGGKLSYFKVEGVTTKDNKNVPTLFFPKNSSTVFNCRVNNLKFANMPQMRVIISEASAGYPNDAANYYACSSQADSINSAGNKVGIPIDLTSAYAATVGPYKTAYEWYSDRAFTSKLNPQPSGSDGVYTFNSLVSGNVYCKITNPLFSLKTEALYPEYAEDLYSPWPDFTDNGYADLVLCYQTTLYKTTGISNPDNNNSFEAYLSKNTLYINNDSEISSVSVFDLSGKQVYQGAYTTNNISIDASMWQKGLYIVKVNAANGIYTQKVVK